MNRNFFFVALIVLVALSTLALSGPLIAHNNNIFLAGNSSNATTPSCNSSVTCAKKGAACTKNYDAANSTSTDCAQGLWCINSICATDNIGANCSTASDCYLPSNALIIPPYIQAMCSGGVCAYAYQIGDTCTNNTDCMSGLFCNTTTSMCDGLNISAKCNITGPYTGAAPWFCGYGMTCAPKEGNGNTVCQNQIAKGTHCGGDISCGPWLFCPPGSNSTCQTQYSVADNGTCRDDTQCSSGLCLMKSCVSVAASLTTCTVDSDCTVGIGGTCYCSEYSGKQYCVGIGYIPNPCTSEVTSLVTCLAGANCTEATNAPNSCSYQNCASEYKKTFSCGCSIQKTMTGSCSYIAYCGGFPIWAIILIIVIAIVLVLGIVLLVFFMMRRRRQYESI